MLHRIRIRAVIWLTKRSRLFPLFQHLRGKTTGKFCTARTDLCIEGFESSANSFLYNIFREIRPDLNIAHHTHSVANMKRAKMYNVPTLVLYREPADAIPSLVSRFRPELDEAILRYVCFYRYVASIRDFVLLVSFEEATGAFGNVLRRLEARSGLSFGSFNPEAVEKRVVSHIEHWSEQRDKGQEMALPVDERERQKKAIRSAAEKKPMFAEAKRLYQDMCDADEHSDDFSV